MTADLRGRCRANLDAVRERVAAACHRVGRDPAGVRIVGVTKYVDENAARMLLEAGCLDLAESRPQSLWRKAETLAAATPPPRWHLVGHLQRNKIRRTIGLLTLLHSLDSLRLLEAIEAEAAAAGRVCDALVEVNISGDHGRTGVPEPEVAAVLAAAVDCPHVRIGGLMGMAGLPDDAAGGDGLARRQFGRLRELRDRLATPPVPLAELSMGMSDDFEDAILEGATLVRIGSALWEGIADADGPLPA
jgi:pyridoxal phosphate enzyme (YggS family)